jgi:hypothetical protein
MLLPHATLRASEGHFVRALQVCVHYFSAYARIMMLAAELNYQSDFKYVILFMNIN